MSNPSFNDRRATMRGPNVAYLGSIAGTGWLQHANELPDDALDKLLADKRAPWDAGRFGEMVGEEG